MEWPTERQGPSLDAITTSDMSPLLHVRPVLRDDGCAEVCSNRRAEPRINNEFNSKLDLARHPRNRLQFVAHNHSSV